MNPGKTKWSCQRILSNIGGNLLPIINIQLLLGTFVSLIRVIVNSFRFPNVEWYSVGNHNIKTLGRHLLEGTYGCPVTVWSGGNRFPLMNSMTASCTQIPRHAKQMSMTVLQDTLRGQCYSSTTTNINILFSTIVMYHPTPWGQYNSLHSISSRSPSGCLETIPPTFTAKLHNRNLIWNSLVISLKRILYEIVESLIINQVFQGMWRFVHYKSGLFLLCSLI